MLAGTQKMRSKKGNLVVPTMLVETLSSVPSSVLPSSVMDSTVGLKTNPNWHYDPFITDGFVSLLDSI